MEEPEVGNAAKSESVILDGAVVKDEPESSILEAAAVKNESTPQLAPSQNHVIVPEFGERSVVGQELVGKRISVFWAGDGAWYAGRVTSYQPRGTLHTVLYDDGEEKRHRLQDECWNLEGEEPGEKDTKEVAAAYSAPPSAHSSLTVDTLCATTVAAASAVAGPSSVPTPSPGVIGKVMTCNTAEREEDCWRWELTLHPEVEVEGATMRLHPTFKPNIVAMIRRPDGTFTSGQLHGWGTFRVGIELTVEKQAHSINHMLSFEAAETWLTHELSAAITGNRERRASAGRASAVWKAPRAPNPEVRLSFGCGRSHGCSDCATVPVAICGR